MVVETSFCQLGSLNFLGVEFIKMRRTICYAKRPSVSFKRARGESERGRLLGDDHERGPIYDVEWRELSGLR